MTKFKGCIDIHSGKVKQIVASTLDTNSLRTNFVAEHPSSYYPNSIRTTMSWGTHVIKLGPGCDEAAKAALAAWPNHLQVGGGITDENAAEWVHEHKASKVIVTSFLFVNGGKEFSLPRLESLVKALDNDTSKIVIDLSCRRKQVVDPVTQEVTGTKWFVATNRWQTITPLEVNKETLEFFAKYCSEFLIHAADVEGLCKGIDEDLVRALGEWSPLPCVYAGGAKSIEDLELVKRLSNGKVDLTFGSALDIFGGNQVKFTDCVEWNSKQ